MSKKINQVLAIVLTIAALLTGQSVYAESSWTVEETSHNDDTNETTFTITRSETGYAQTVLYRTISLSAYAGQHYTAASGSISFGKDDNTKTVIVKELTPSGSFKYQVGTKERKYRLEVTDRAGFRLDYADRKMTNGKSFSADKVSKSITNLVTFNISGNYTSSVNSSKYVDVSYTPPTSQVETSGTLKDYVLIDDSYDYANKPATVSTSDLINTTGANATYLNDIGYKIYATVCFTEKERDDGYQYILIIAGNSSANYDTGYDPDGAVNDPANSVYKACFELSDGSNAEGKQFFPHRYSYANKTAETSANIGITEFSQTNGHLWQQKFKSSSYQANNSGSLIFDANVGNITTRFDAGGKDNDTWGYKDFFVRMALVDESAPTMSAISVNPGRHAKGNTVYVSVAFSEIVTWDTSPMLQTTDDNHWGTLTYVAGEGTNVVTFSTTIPQDATGSLNITRLSGTVKDLAGNVFSGDVTADNLCSLDADLVYAISDFKRDVSGNYLIQTHDDLRGLAGYVNSGGTTSGKTFLQVGDIAFPYTTNWNYAYSKENNFTAIGNYKSNSDDKSFMGTYDGGGYTISGIRIYKNTSGQTGLFSYVHNGGTVCNVHLINTRITGKQCVGGIVGVLHNDGTVEDCSVGSTVCIHAVVTNAEAHGGIAGFDFGTVQRCISRAILTVADETGCQYYGSIAGYTASTTISDCIAIDAVIPNVRNRGVIFGYEGNDKNILTRNYYRNCTIAGASDSNIYPITLGTNVIINRTPATDPLPGTGNYTYDNGADIAGVPYSYEGATLTLGYSGDVSTGYHVVYSATAGTIDGDELTMPAGAVTVSATVPANTYTVRFNANGGDGSMDDQEFTYDAAQSLSANAFTAPTGHHFAGWNTQADGTGTNYTDQQTTPNVTAENNATVTLYAQWITPVDYIDENGVVQTTPEGYPVYSFTGTETTLGASGKTTWYIIQDNIKVVDNIEDNDYVWVELAGDVNIILADGCSFDGGFFYQLYNFNHHSLTIYAQSTGDDMGSFKHRHEIRDGNFNIRGGNIYIYCGGSSNPLFDNCSVSITGGRVTLSSEDKLFYDSTVTLGCTALTDYIKFIDGYTDKDVNVIIKDGQILSDGSHLYSGTLANGNNSSYQEESELEVNRLHRDVTLQTYTGSLLADNDSDKPAGSKNEDIINTLDDGDTYTVALQGRIFYQDFDWNTLCLPFDLDIFSGTPFSAATVMELDVDGTYDEWGNAATDGEYKTGFDASNGKLYLYFKEATRIEAGKPYLVKWYDNERYYNPVFTNVTIDNSTAAQARKTVTSKDGKVSFCGTYGTIDYAATNRSILFIGSSNSLYYPQAGAHIGAFRAYFQLTNGLTIGNGGGSVKAFKLSFGESDEQPDAINRPNSLTPDPSPSRGEEWFDLNGRKLSGKPTKRGIYIVNGRKVLY